MVVAYLDIETSSKRADDGMVVAIGLLIGDKPEVRFADSFDEEQKALEWLCEKLEKCDGIVTWYGSGFDIPFLSTRAIVHKVNLTKLIELPMLDLYEWSKANLLLYSYSLESVARFLGVSSGKEFHGSDVPTLFKLVERGDIEARRLIVEHCEEDLILLKLVHERLKPTVGRARWGSPRKTSREG